MSKAIDELGWTAGRCAALIGAEDTTGIEAHAAGARAAVEVARMYLEMRRDPNHYGAR
ncbi:hypothetical protein [Actinomadura kijaniata]|uniref:hypothetical protein n=1 Tax=Actinomadura kijaniata TaxID=46161 RepID=UPI001471C1AF|nr:hypothetical protein [Actinomadura kijaniata]